MRAISVEDMRAYETNSVWLGVGLEKLMENAGAAVARRIVEKAGASRMNVAVLAGKGGNGGDGFVAARHLAAMGASVTVHLAYPVDLVKHPAARSNLEALLRDGTVRVVEPWRPGWLDLQGVDVVVDALLGIGVKGSLREPIRTMARAFTTAQALRVSIDTPTGVDPDTGSVAEGAAVADVTIALHRAKRGLLEGRARLHTGELVVEPIGLPPAAERLAGPGDVAARIPARPRDAHKGVGGRVLVVAGSDRFPGAAMLAALGAAQAGADLVYLSAPGGAALQAAGMHSAIVPVPRGESLDGGEVERLRGSGVLEKAHVIVAGPGLGRDRETLEALRSLIEEAGKPVVLDADALALVEDGWRPGEAPVVVTPHRGEAYRLTGESEPRQAAVELARRGYTALVKGPIDYICGAGGFCRENRAGVPEMSVGGTGDVLAGVVGGFLARRIAAGRAPDPVNIAAAAAYTVGRAGELALGEGGSAFDVARAVPRVIEEARGLA